MDFGFFVYCFVALFIIVDPIINVPVFMTILQRFKPKHRLAMIKTAVFAAFLILVAFSVVGGRLLSYLGVELSSFKIAGGILLFIVAIETLFAQPSRTKIHPNTFRDAKERESISISPLGTPLLTGPGAITTGVVLFESASGVPEIAMFLLAALAVFVLTYMILSKSELIHKKIGDSAMRAVVRVMGLVLAAMAVNLVVQGIKTAFGVV